MTAISLRVTTAVLFCAILLLAASVIAAKNDKLKAAEKRANTEQTQASAESAESNSSAKPTKSAGQPDHSTNTGANQNLATSSPQAGEEIKWDVLSSGGGPMTSTNFRLDGTLGQTVAGPSTSTNFTLRSGYWQDFGDGVDYVCGDADGSGSVNIGDAVYLVNYIFASGPAPDPLESGDSDCSTSINIGDAVYLVNYIFASGPAPCAGCPTA